MKEGTFKQDKAVNADRLHEEMQEALGSKYISMDTGVRERIEDTSNLKIVVRLTDEATDDDKKRVEELIDAHNPVALSKTQQKQKERADAFVRMVGRDLRAARNLPAAAKLDAILDALEDIQKLLQGAGL